MVELLKLVFERVPLHLSYFFQKVDNHSIQAPFAFSLYELISKPGFPEIKKIEDHRALLIRSGDTINYQTFGKKSSLPIDKRRKISAIVNSGISSQYKSRLLASLIKEFKCKVILELGSSLGINTAYLAEASPQGTVYTFEGHPGLCHLANGFFKQLNYDQVVLLEGNIDEKLPEVLNSITAVDFAFIDANHTSQGLLMYFNQLINRIHKKSIIVIDDIRWSKDMHRGWKEVVKNERVSHSYDMGDVGILFFQEGIKKQNYIV